MSVHPLVLVPHRHPERERNPRLPRSEARVEYIYLPTVDLLDPSLPLTAAATKRGFSVTLVAHTVGDTSVALRFWETDATEVADAVDKSTKTFYIVFVGV